MLSSQTLSSRQLPRLCTPSHAALCRTRSLLRPHTCRLSRYERQQPGQWGHASAANVPCGRTSDPAGLRFGSGWTSDPCRLRVTVAQLQVSTISCCRRGLRAFFSLIPKTHYIRPTPPGYESAGHRVNSSQPSELINTSHRKQHPCRAEVTPRLSFTRNPTPTCAPYV